MTVDEYNKSVDLFADGVYRFILNNIKDVERARDVVQDSFEKMWKRARHVDYKKAKSYLYTTAYHTMIDHLRRDQYYIRWDEEGPEEADHSNHFSDLKELLEEALEKLPGIQKSVVLLRDYEGYSYKEIGEITGLNEPQVKVYIYRARMALKNYIGKLENVI